MSAVRAPNDDRGLSLDVMERWVQARPVLAGVYAELQCGEREMELMLRRHERRRRRHDVETNQNIKKGSLTSDPTRLRFCETAALLHYFTSWQQRITDY